MVETVDFLKKMNKRKALLADSPDKLLPKWIKEGTCNTTSHPGKMTREISE